MKTLEQLQDPATLRLHMGELDANELRVAQAAVRFAYSQMMADPPQIDTGVRMWGRPVVKDAW